MLIYITGLNSVFRDDFRQYDTKPLFYAHFDVFFGQMPLRNSVAMATPKIPGNQRLFERVCYMLKVQVTKFQLPRRNGF